MPSLISDFFTRCYLKLRLVVNNFWEKNIKSSHCVVLRKGQWTRLSQKKNDATQSTLCQNKKVIHNPYISLLISFFASEKENAAWKIVWNHKTWISCFETLCSKTNQLFYKKLYRQFQLGRKFMEVTKNENALAIHPTYLPKPAGKWTNFLCCIFPTFTYTRSLACAVCLFVTEVVRSNFR